MGSFHSVVSGKSAFEERDADASLGFRGSTDSMSKKQLGPMQVQFATDFAFEATLRSALSVEFCSHIAETEVYSDVLIPIVQMLSPRIATTAELDAEDIDWKNPEKAMAQIAQLEMSDGKLLGQGYYLRAAIAYFGEGKWWKLCTSFILKRESLAGVLFCMVESKVRPNETVFGLTIPPKGHALRRDSIANPNFVIFVNFPNALIAHMSARHSVDAKLALLRTLKQFIDCEEEWNEMLLRPCIGQIPAIVYLRRLKGKASKRVFRALVPAEISLTDAAFWYEYAPDAFESLRRMCVRADVVNDFKNWVGAEAVAALLLSAAQMKNGSYDLPYLGRNAKKTNQETSKLYF